MTIRQEMRAAARRAKAPLGDRAAGAAGFIADREDPAGGFRGRGERGDLYYSMFALEALAALDAAVPRAGIESWLGSFGAGDDLDLVHLACLARCWADLDKPGAGGSAEAILARVEAHRSADGGYGTAPGCLAGSAYTCFLAVGAYQDLQAPLCDPHRTAACLTALRAEDGGYSNSPNMPVGSTAATAAAVTALRHLGSEVDESAARWLTARRRTDGGFGAWSAAPVSDLLSTAVALHALAGLRAPLDDIRKPCMDFVNSLWSADGAFRGHAGDEVLDCEYTYYGLLALGHLSDPT